MAILAGLGAALVWAAGNLAAARASRVISPSAVLAGISLIGLVVCAPILITEGAPHDVSVPALGWLALGGTANIAGLGLLYIAYRAGDVGLVAPISSTEGAVAAVIAIAAGERVQSVVLLLLAVIVLGVIRVAAGGTGQIALHRLNWGVVTVALLAAGCFGIGLYATGRASALEQFGWVAAAPRIAGVILVALPLALRGEVQITSAAAPLVLLAACGEAGGFSLYWYAAHHSLAVAAVLASLFAAFAVVGAAILFGERMSRRQWLGVATIAAGVAALSAVTG